MELELREAEAALLAAEAASAAAKEKAGTLLERSERADDYRQIMNAMGKHVFGYYGQIQEEELEKYWSRRDDIVYAHGDMAYYGRENVFNYYTGMTAAMKAQGRATAEKFYGKTYDEQYGPGYKVMNMLLSPYVEIAADRQTARGIWMAFSYMTHLNPDTGKPDTSLGLSQYECEFIREDGQWKLWHRVDHVECGLKYLGVGSMMPPSQGGPGSKKNGPGGPGGPGSPNGPPPAMPAALKDIPKKTLCQRSGGQSPCEPSYPEPAIPEPYDSWTYEKSYIVVEHDGYETKMH